MITRHQPELNTSKKRETGRSTLYSFDGPFQLPHADIGNLEFLGMNATFPQYALVVFDIYSIKSICLPNEIYNTNTTENEIIF